MPEAAAVSVSDTLTAAKRLMTGRFVTMAAFADHLPSGGVLLCRT
jgi:hypothetical protein